MHVLGIETSCDETSAAIVRGGRKVLSNVVSSSLSLHCRYGGVIPEIASRMQLETIAAVTEAAFKKAAVGLNDIDAISVTSGPGLLGSLLVGISFSRALGLSAAIPVLEVNHLMSHIYAVFLNSSKVPALPFVALVVSGGHTSLFHVTGFGAAEELGHTRDDACGEAFDKVAKLLGLAYPGGPLIEKIASKGDCRRIKFNCSDTRQPLDFSFSGIKTAVMYLVRKKKELAPKEKRDIAASFQEAVFGVLVDKAISACRMQGAKNLVVAGGVAANSRLREKFIFSCRQAGVGCYFPAPSLCTDNAAMVAGLGCRIFKEGGKGAVYA
ncbi:MAG: tRNA (adenosine(37)-N6)-threonylcarbamoyltransferase complex transferase subunit TsaD [Candidatus Omnitrophota bacterium]